eukprot:3070055-Pyramimonas_sp.AAC.1
MRRGRKRKNGRGGYGGGARGGGRGGGHPEVRLVRFGAVWGPLGAFGSVLGASWGLLGPSGA